MQGTEGEDARNENAKNRLHNSWVGKCKKCKMEAKENARNGNARNGFSAV